jgi:hypothetical protein
MIDVGRLYEPFSIPLEVVENPIIGEIYYNSEGHALLCTGENEFRFIRRSELREGEIVESLTPRQLALFWTLTKNRRKFADLI